MLFLLGDRVKVGDGLERGEVVARAEYLTSEAQYLVRYVAGDGRCVETWWTESALKPA